MLLLLLLLLLLKGPWRCADHTQYYKGRWWQGEVSFPFGYTNGVRVACGPGGKEQVLHVSTGDLRLYTLRDGSLVGVAIRKVRTNVWAVAEGEAGSAFLGERSLFLGEVLS